MDFRHTDEQKSWKDMLHTFMEREVGREYTRAHDESRQFPDEVYAKMADNGWLGLLLPEDLGGSAADPVMFAIFCEAIAKFSLDTAACIMTSMFTATNLSAHGTPEQQKAYLPDYLEGRRKFAISISEPQAGSDAAGLQTKAVKDGDDWVLNGNKVWCSGAHLPGTAIIMLARTSEDRHKGISMFIVPNDTPGLDIRKMPTIVRRSLGTTEIFLEDVRLPAESLIGEVGGGWDYVREHLDWERLGLAASYIGNARTALDDTKAYAKERIAFGKPISSFQVVKHRMVEDETALTAARLLTYYAADKLARGELASMEVSMAKVYTAEVAFKIAFNGMQTLGGYAQLPEYDMERYFREAKHGMVGGGANEIQRTVIGRAMGL